LLWGLALLMDGGLLLLLWLLRGTKWRGCIGATSAKVLWRSTKCRAWGGTPAKSLRGWHGAHRGATNTTTSLLLLLLQKVRVSPRGNSCRGNTTAKGCTSRGGTTSKLGCRGLLLLLLLLLPAQGQGAHGRGGVERWEGAPRPGRATKPTPRGGGLELGAWRGGTTLWQLLWGWGTKAPRRCGKAATPARGPTPKGLLLLLLLALGRRATHARGTKPTGCTTSNPKGGLLGGGGWRRGCAAAWKGGLGCSKGCPTGGATRVWGTTPSTLLCRWGYTITPLLLLGCTKGMLVVHQGGVCPNK